MRLLPEILVGTPIAFAIIIGGLASAFVLWRRTLQSDFASIGFRPLIAGLSAIALGLFLLAFHDASNTFDRMREVGTLIQYPRAAYIVGSLGGLMVSYSLNAVLPVAFILVPIVAYLIHRRRFAVPTIAIFVLLSWVAAVALMQEAKPFVAREKLHPAVTFVTTDAATALRVLAAVEFSFVVAVWQQTRSR